MAGVGNTGFRVSLGINNRGFNQGLRNSASRLTGFSRRVETQGTASLRRFSRTAERAGANLTRRLTLPLVGAGAAIGRFAFNAERGLTRVSTLTGVSANEVQALSVELRQLGRTSGIATDQLAEGLLVAVSAGFRAREALEITNSAAQLTNIGFGDLATVTRALTVTVENFGSAGLTASRAADVLLATVQTGNFEAAELGRVFGRLLAPANALGITIEGISAAFSSLTRNTGSATEAQTQLNAILNTFLKPSGEAREALDQVGLSVDDVRIALRERGLYQTLRLISGSLRTLGIDLTAVFGSAEATRGVLALTDAAGSFEEIYDQIVDSLGDANRASLQWAETNEGRLTTSLSALRSQAVDLGAQVLPVAAGALERISAAAGFATTGFANLESSTQNALVGFGLIAAGAPIAISQLGRLGRLGAGGVARFRGAQANARELGEAFRERQSEARLREGLGFYARGTARGQENTLGARQRQQIEREERFRAAVRREETRRGAEQLPRRLRGQDVFNEQEVRRIQAQQDRFHESAMREGERLGREEARIARLRERGARGADSRAVRSFNFRNNTRLGRGITGATRGFRSFNAALTRNAGSVALATAGYGGLALAIGGAAAAGGLFLSTLNDTEPELVDSLNVVDRLTQSWDAYRAAVGATEGTLRQFLSLPVGEREDFDFSSLRTPEENIAVGFNTLRDLEQQDAQIFDDDAVARAVEIFEASRGLTNEEFRNEADRALQRVEDERSKELTDLFNSRRFGVGQLNPVENIDAFVGGAFRAGYGDRFFQGGDATGALLDTTLDEASRLGNEGEVRARFGLAQEQLALSLRLAEGARANAAEQASRYEEIYEELIPQLNDSEQATLNEARATAEKTGSFTDFIQVAIELSRVNRIVLETTDDSTAAALNNASATREMTDAGRRFVSALNAQSNAFNRVATAQVSLRTSLGLDDPALEREASLQALIESQTEAAILAAGNTISIDPDGGLIDRYNSLTITAVEEWYQSIDRYVRSLASSGEFTAVDSVLSQQLAQLQQLEGAFDESTYTRLLARLENIGSAAREGDGDGGGTLFPDVDVEIARVETLVEELFARFPVLSSEHATEFVLQTFGAEVNVRDLFGSTIPQLLRDNPQFLNLSPEQAYAALDTFIQRVPPELLVQFDGNAELARAEFRRIQERILNTTLVAAVNADPSEFEQSILSLQRRIENDTITIFLDANDTEVQRAIGLLRNNLSGLGLINFRPSGTYGAGTNFETPSGLREVDILAQARTTLLSVHDGYLRRRRGGDESAGILRYFGAIAQGNRERLASYFPLIDTVSSFHLAYLRSLPQFARGGIVTRPTLGVIGEGGSPEAVVPLDRANQYGFGGGGNSYNVIFQGDVYGDRSSITEAVREGLIAFERANGVGTALRA